MARKKSFLTTLLRFIIVILVIFAIILGVAYFTTPRTFGLNDVEIGGATLEKLGLADVTFFEMGGVVSDMLSQSAKEEYVGNDDVATKEDEESVVGKFEDATTENSQEEEVEKEDIFKNVMIEKLVFEEEKEIEVESAELVSIFNLALGTAQETVLQSDVSKSAERNNLVENGNGELAKLNMADYSSMSTQDLGILLKDYNAKFIKLVPSMDGEQMVLETVVSVELPNDILETINSIGIITLEKEVYISFSPRYNLKDGELEYVGGEETVEINSMSMQRLKLLLMAASGLIGEDFDVAETIDSYCQAMGNVIGGTINNIGLVDGAKDGVLQLRTHTK